MTRGRKKDLTIPPTRALVQQRDYRARKAHYIADLEERVRKAEAENAQLRKDLEAARARPGLPPLFSPQAVEASRELMQHLTLAANTLNRFHQLAFPGQSTPTILPSMQLSPSLPELPDQHRPASFPSPAPSPPYSQATLQSTLTPTIQSPSRAHPPEPLLPTHTPSRVFGRKRLYREDSPEAPLVRNVASRPSERECTLSPESECCGGILDCKDLVEDTRNDEDDDRLLGQLSVMRSTSEHLVCTR